MRRAAAASLIVAAVAGCLFPDLSGLQAGDASTNDVALDAIVTDGGDASTAVCDPSKPFTAITPIAELNDADDQYKPTLTPDELEIWFGFTQQLDGSNVIHVMHAKRGKASDPFGAPVIEANIAPGDVDPAVTDDGLGLYYAKFGTVGNWDIFEATRPTRSDVFGIGAQLPLPMQSSTADTAPFVAFDRSLWFLSARSGTNHVWHAPFVDGGLATPALDTSLSSSSANNDNGVVLSHDGLWAYVSSDRTDVTSAGSYDIFVTHRSTIADGFGAFTNVTEANSAKYDRADWLSWDNCRLYFESSRNSSGGNADLFVASRTP